MNENFLVSVVVPVYNVEQYLEDCLQSILDQSYKNLEIIIVNDGSTDKSLSVCRQFEKKDSRIILIDKDNGGLSDARNHGIDMAKGEYICFIDSDDVVHKDFISFQISNIDSNDLTIVNYQTFNEISELKNLNISTDFAIIPFTRDEAINKIESFKYPLFVLAWNKLYKKELWKQLRYPKGRIHEDEFVVHHLLNKCNKIAFIDLPLYYYRQRKDSIMSSAKSVKSVNDKLDAYVDRKNFYLEKGLVDRVEDLKALISTKCALKEVSRENQYFKNLSLKDVLLNERISYKYRILLFLKKNFSTLYKLIYSLKSE